MSVKIDYDIIRASWKRCLFKNKESVIARREAPWQSLCDLSRLLRSARNDYLLNGKTFVSQNNLFIFICNGGLDSFSHCVC